MSALTPIRQLKFSRDLAFALALIYSDRIPDNQVIESLLVNPSSVIRVELFRFPKNSGTSSRCKICISLKELIQKS